MLVSLAFIPTAEAGDRKLTIEPLYGVETALVRYPEPPRYVSRATYGARALYGTNLLSAELEFTEAHSRKDYPTLNQQVVDKAQRLALGVRSTIGLGSYLGVYGRLGGRAAQLESTVTTAGISETHKEELDVQPYAGAGLQLAFAANFALNAGVTLIRNSNDQYDSQYTLGLTARIGSL